MKLIVLGDGTVPGTRVLNEEGNVVANARIVTHKADAHPIAGGVQCTVTLARAEGCLGCLGSKIDGRRVVHITPEQLEADPVTEIEIHNRIPNPRISFGIESTRQRRPADWEDAMGAALDANTDALNAHTNALREQPL